MIKEEIENLFARFNEKAKETYESEQEVAAFEDGLRHGFNTCVAILRVLVETLNEVGNYNEEV